VRVVDANGSGVANTPIHLVPSSGSVADSALTTDELGLAKVRWTMGRLAGEHSLAVRVEGVKKLVKVAALTMPAAAANLSFDDAPAPAKSAKPKVKSRHLYAVVTDVYGNPVPDAKVMFSTKSGTVTPARAVSDTRGRAELTWTPGVKPGEQTLVGSVRSTDVTGKYTMVVGGAAHEAPARASSSRSIPVKKGER
jgi:Bacterial Ig-like domain (group 1)